MIPRPLISLFRPYLHKKIKTNYQRATNNSALKKQYKTDYILSQFFLQIDNCIYDNLTIKKMGLKTRTNPNNKQGKTRRSS